MTAFTRPKLITENKDRNTSDLTGNEVFKISFIKFYRRNDHRIPKKRNTQYEIQSPVNQQPYNANFAVECCMGFPGGSVVNNLPANVGHVGSIFGLGRSPGEGNGTHSSILA